ncbi:Mrp/NBP35 family ATP-binding protein [Pacificimonas sp. WHA3]|uniref:Iron-sulfur cluster carrier protein n=1 Tax=Pacificimonas pallii TaxID=2827236 RepID=A0ABS6SGU1_9SPHN|nr:Mrp/NBP35 family ATP-binding protein [Pacificimonas pallii]MBV7257632.1 Mrp/NBP35 family ATP-binding protein [Pacificimonas pallii]
MTETELRAALSKVRDPAAGADVIASGRVSGVMIRGGQAGYVLDTGGLSQGDVAALKSALDQAAPGARVITTSEMKAAPKKAAAPHDVPAAKLENVGRIIAVASGKGGVGKSTISANLAVALAQAGERVGLLDADIYGPSVPMLLGLEGRAEGVQGRIQPMHAHGIKALSIAALTKPGQAVIWRGPMAAAAMIQMLTDADWGELDTLIIDMPPGTGDIQLSLAQKIAGAEAVIVSTPQDLALIDAEKAIAMFGKVGIPVLGIVENMSTFVCPACGAATDIFGHGGAEETSKARGVPFLGAVPLTMALRKSADAGLPAVLGDGEAADALRQVAGRLLMKQETR